MMILLASFAALAALPAAPASAAPAPVTTTRVCAPHHLNLPNGKGLVTTIMRCTDRVVAPQAEAAADKARRNS